MSQAQRFGGRIEIKMVDCTVPYRLYSVISIVSELKKIILTQAALEYFNKKIEPLANIACSHYNT